MVFDGESLSTVVAEFNRYNRRQLHIADSATARTPFTGRFEATDLESFLEALERLNIRAKEEGRGPDARIELSRH